MSAIYIYVCAFVPKMSLTKGGLVSIKGN